MRLFACALALVLFFSGDEKQTWREKYEQKDSLALYLEKLFELTDDDAFHLSNKTDSLLQTLWRQPKTTHEQIAYLNFILNTAYHLLQQGQVQASTKRYEQGLRYLQQHDLNYETEEFIIKPLGNNYVRTGDYDKAIALQQAAINSALQKDKKELLSSLYSNLAISFFWLGNNEETQIQCNKGLQFISFNKTVTGLLYNVKADAFYRAAVKDSVSFYNQKSLAFFRSPDAYEADAVWIVSALELSSKLSADKNQFTNAVQKLQNAEKVLHQFFPETRQRDKAKLKVQKGTLLLQLGKVDSALADFQKGLQFFQIKETYFPDNTVTALYYGLAKVYKAKSIDSSLHYYQLALQNDYYTNQLVSSSFNSLQSSLDNEELSEEAIAYFSAHAHQLKSNMQLLWLMELSKARKLLNEVNRSSQWQQDSLQKETTSLFAELRNDYLLLAETEDAIKKAAISERIREKELQLGLKESRFDQFLQQPSYEQFEHKMKQLQQSSTLLSYYFTKDSLIICKASGNNMDFKTFGRSNVSSTVSSFVQTYFSPASSAFSNNPTAYFQKAVELKQLLIGTDSTAQPLIISPHTVLHFLPFEALCVNGDGLFLGQTTAISYVYSFQQYVHDLTTKSNKLNITALSFNSNHLGFNALPNSIQEVKTLQQDYKATTADAVQTNETTFLELMQQPSVLHIASHAVADSSNQPYIVLNKKFYIGQLQYVLTSSPLVVLTACETAAGSLQQGEGVMSIGRAFLSKGVPAVVASRWKVDDAVSPVLVQQFYQSLSKQASAITALYEARKHYLQTVTGVAQKNPLLWSGFCYMGTEQTIQLQSSSFNWYWLLLLLVVPVGFLLKKVKL